MGKKQFFGFNVHGSVHRNNILIYKSQQDEHVTEFILSDNCSTSLGASYSSYLLKQRPTKVDDLQKTPE
jgi:hypothetical protein